MNIAVLGAGQLGIACSLALLAGNCSQNCKLAETNFDISLVNSDHDSTSETVTINRKKRSVFSIYKRDKIFVPDELHLSSYDKLCKSEINMYGIVVCRPFEESSEELRQIVHKNSTNSYTFDDNKLNNLFSSFAIIFSCGIDAHGNFPCDVYQKIVSNTDYISNKRQHYCPLFIAGGPIYPSEWALQSSTYLERSNIAKSENHKKKVEDEYTFMEQPDDNTECSATSLVFALHESKKAANKKGLEEECEFMLKSLFTRENVYFLRNSDCEYSAEILSLVKCCQPLCSFGAGIVSNVFADCVTSALASYALNASAATQELVNLLLNRKKETPLPLSVMSIIFSSCHNFNTSEFTLGRNILFYSHQNDTLTHTCRLQMHQYLSASFDGLYKIMKEKKVKCRLYEMLIDAFNLIEHPANVGEALVHGGDCSKKRNRSSKLYSNLNNVFEAVFSGDEDAFCAAKDEFVRKFEAATTPLWQQVSKSEDEEERNY